MRVKILGTEIALPVTSGTATTLNGATEVRLIHDQGGNTAHLVTILDSADATIGTFSMTPGEHIVIRKRNTDKLFASDNDIRAVSVSYQA